MKTVALLLLAISLLAVGCSATQCEDGSKPLSCNSNLCQNNTCINTKNCAVHYCDTCGFDCTCRSDLDCNVYEFCRYSLNDTNSQKVCVPLSTEGQTCGGVITDLTKESRCLPQLDCVDIRNITDARGVCRRPCFTDSECIDGGYCSNSGYCLNVGECALNVVDCHNSFNTWTTKCNGSFYCTQNATCADVCGPLTCQPQTFDGAYLCPKDFHCNTTNSNCDLGNLAACACPASPKPTPHPCHDGFYSTVLCDSYVQYNNCTWVVGACLSSAPLSVVLSSGLLFVALIFVL